MNLDYGQGAEVGNGNYFGFQQKTSNDGLIPGNCFTIKADGEQRRVFDVSQGFVIDHLDVKVGWNHQTTKEWRWAIDGKLSAKPTDFRWGFSAQVVLPGQILATWMWSGAAAKDCMIALDNLTKQPPAAGQLPVLSWIETRQGTAKERTWCFPAFSIKSWVNRPPLLQAKPIDTGAAKTIAAPTTHHVPPPTIPAPAPATPVMAPVTPVMAPAIPPAAMEDDEALFG